MNIANGSLFCSLIEPTSWVTTTRHSRWMMGTNPGIRVLSQPYPLLSRCHQAFRNSFVQQHPLPQCLALPWAKGDGAKQLCMGTSGTMNQNKPSFLWLGFFWAFCYRNEIWHRELWKAISTAIVPAKSKTKTWRRSGSRKSWCLVPNDEEGVKGQVITSLWRNTHPWDSVIINSTYFHCCVERSFFTFYLIFSPPQHTRVSFLPLNSGDRTLVFWLV